MSKGPGKIQRLILEYLQEKADKPPQKHWMHQNGWCYASNAVYHAYEDKRKEFEPLTMAQYNAGMRAINQLAKRGLIEKKVYTSDYDGKRRGPLRRWQLPEDREESCGSYVSTLYVRFISVDPNVKTTLETTLIKT